MKKLVVLCLLLSTSALLFAAPGEGMYPLSELKRIDLKKAGFGLTMEELFSNRSDALVNALVRVGGCTGSFVSQEGLIITNHHCVFGAVAAASSVEQDYITAGFIARNRNAEIPAKGLTVRITVGFEDVSAEVVAAAGNEKDAVKRLAAMREKMRQIKNRAEAADPKLTHEVSEMFLGRSYVLFHYQTIQDIRLVYAPPRSIGEFGGESDNWVWPRHNGDFSFVRAYVAPDGSPATFDEKNVPFKPKRHLKVNPQGVAENDFVFILGYPGRTFRHYPAEYIRYQQDYLLPQTAATYDWLIDYMKALGKADPAKAIAFASKMKGLANVTKNYKGKMQGLRRIQLVASKKEEEARLQAMLDKNPEMAAQFAGVFEGLNAVYTDMQQQATMRLWLNFTFGQSASMAVAGRIAQIQLGLDTVAKKDKAAFIEKQANALKSLIQRAYAPYDASLDRDFLERMFLQTRTWPEENQLLTLKTRYGKANGDEKLTKMLDKLVTSSVFTDKEALLKLLDEKPEKLFKTKHALVSIANEMVLRLNVLNQQSAQQEATLAGLLPKYLDLKIASGMDFIPDANATLRLTFGEIKGYEPEDGVIQHPFTSLSGMLAKGDSVGDYEISQSLVDAYQAGNHTAYQHPALQDVPVGLLYNLDTTGGNSGSPVMNAQGELIGVNFDRAYTATINDFAWNEQYSRSIGVDIRFVLWTLDKVAKADFLIQEMGIQ